MESASAGPEIVRLGKEHAEIAPVAEAVRRLLTARAEREDLARMAGDADPDLAEMAREDLGRLDADLPDLERGIALLLAPRDADENASAILEVRAGTGGDDIGFGHDGTPWNERLIKI